MKYSMLVAILFLFCGCSLVSNSTMDKELLAKITEDEKTDDSVKFDGARSFMHYSPTYQVNAEGAQKVTMPDPDKDAAHFKRMVEALESEKIRALNESKVSINLRLKAEKERDIAIEEKQHYESKSSLYILGWAISCIIFVVAGGLLCYVLRSQLGIKTTALGDALADIATLQKSKKKWANRGKAFTKRATKQIDYIERRIAENSITPDVKSILNHSKNWLRDTVNEYHGNKEIDEE